MNKEKSREYTRVKRCANCGITVKTAELCGFCAREKWRKEHPERVKQYNKNAIIKRRERRRLKNAM